MNQLLKTVLEENTPKFNKKVINGLSQEFLPKVADFINSVLISAMRSSTPKFQYHGYRFLTPEEELNVIVPLKGKQEYDIATTDVRLIELMFTYEGEKIPNRYLFIPFVDENGIMKLSGTKYVITPILTDNVISPSRNELFVRLLRDKLIFKSLRLNYIKNDNIKIANIIYSNTLLRTNIKNNRLGNKIITPTGFYLIAKFGLKYTLEHYFNITDVKIIDKSEKDKYKNNYNIYESTNIKPLSLTLTPYEPHNKCIIIPKTYNKDDVDEVDDLIFNVLYAWDVVPYLVNEIVENFNAHNVEREIHYSKVILSIIMYRDSYTIDVAYSNIEEHFNNLESYIDDLIKVKLKEVGIEVNDMFDLILLLTINISNWMASNKTIKDNIMVRYLDVLYYILYNIIVGINKLIGTITKNASKQTLTVEKIKKLFNKNLPMKTFYRVNSSKGINLALNPAVSVNDNKFLTITSLMDSQERGNGVLKDKNSKFPQSMRTMVGSDLFLGNILFLQKSNPSPRFRINPFVSLTDEFRINPTKDDLKIINMLDKLFNNHLDVKIETYEETEDISEI